MLEFVMCIRHSKVVTRIDHSPTLKAYYAQTSGRELLAYDRAGHADAYDNNVD